MDRFELRDYWIGDLAQEYYPDRGYRTAVRFFNKDLRYTKGLRNALRKQGYTEGGRMLTRAQVRVIIKYLGTP